MEIQAFPSHNRGFSKGSLLDEILNERLATQSADINDATGLRESNGRTEKGSP
jgi:hypothetical protein